MSRGGLVRMQVRGFDQLDRLLSRLSQAASEKAVEDSLVETAQPMVEEAQLRAARASVPSKGPEIGHMADSIRVHRLGYVDGVLTVAVTFDREHYWGNFLEIGTPDMPAQPYLRPTQEVLGPSRPKAFSEALGRRIAAKVPEFTPPAGA